MKLAPGEQHDHSSPPPAHQNGLNERKVVFRKRGKLIQSELDLNPYQQMTLMTTRNTLF